MAPIPTMLLGRRDVDGALRLAQLDDVLMHGVLFGKVVANVHQVAQALDVLGIFIMDCAVDVVGELAFTFFTIALEATLSSIQ